MSESQEMRAQIPKTANKHLRVLAAREKKLLIAQFFINPKKAPIQFENLLSDLLAVCKTDPYPTKSSGWGFCGCGPFAS